jgi:nucleotide-binding universal stress UspA family protein
MAAALKAVAFAKRVEARVVAFHSIPAYQYPVYVGGIPFEYPSEEDYETQCRAIANHYLGLIVNAANAQVVPVATRIEFNGSPAQAIVETARSENCSHDLHGFARTWRLVQSFSRQRYAQDLDPGPFASHGGPTNI